MIKTAIIYCRVSTKKQEKDGFSLESQEETCRDFCKMNGWQVYGVYKEAYSGKTSRPILNEAIYNAKENKVNYFVIFDIDRFSREGVGIYQEIKKDLEKSNITLRDSKNIIKEAGYIYKNDLVDMTEYSWNKDDSSEIAEVFVATYAKTEGNKILQRTIPAAIKKEQEGYQVRGARYGFKNKRIREKGTEKSKVIQVPEEPYYSWILEFFESRAKGILTDKEIIKVLNSKGAHKKRSLKPLDLRYMLDRVKDPIYAGFNYSKWTGFKLIKVNYEMFPIELWNQANKGKFFISKIGEEYILEKNINLKNKMKEELKEQFLFQGILKYEGRTLTPYVKKGYKYYRSGRGLPPLNISENKLIKIFEELLIDFTIDEEKTSKIQKLVENFMENEKQSADKILKSINKEILKIKEENKNLIKKNASNLISDEILKELLLENNKKIKENEEILKRENNILELKTSKVHELSKFLLQSKKLWEKANFYQKREMIKLLVHELSFNTKKELVIAETKLYKLLKKSFFL